ERFKRVLLTAVQNNAALATADRVTLFNSAMRAAQDGLLPDGREGAMVIYKTKMMVNGQERWIEAVQWMPMIAGIRKKVRNSGEIATWDCHVVYEKDQFDYELGYEPRINHKPYLAGDPGKVIAAYSVATMKSGEKSCEVMPVHQIERIRQMSKAKDKGPWVDHFSEMCRKTVARRHSKVLPMSTDLDDLMRRDDDLYDMASASDRNQATPAQRPQLVDFVDMPQNEAMTEDPKKTKSKALDKPKHDATTGELTNEPGPPEAMELGREARQAGKPLGSHPAEWGEQGRGDLLDAFQQGWRERDAEISKGNP
ncbi:MAG: recombinase RecT, partial [Betaproteobacteria bacterium]|nr:recombinase RecT [Betaproteobacteria bacterium]